MENNDVPRLQIVLCKGAQEVMTPGFTCSDDLTIYILYEVGLSSTESVERRASGDDSGPHARRWLKYIEVVSSENAFHYRGRWRDRQMRPRAFATPLKCQLQ